MTAKDVRFYRKQAEESRALARLTDEFRRRLIDMAEEYDDRAREAANLIEGPGTGNRASSPPPPKEAVEPVTLSIKDAARLLGLGRTTIYRLIGEGQLETVKIGHRTLIRTTSMRRLVELQD